MYRNEVCAYLDVGLRAPNFGMCYDNGEMKMNKAPMMAGVMTVMLALAAQGETGRFKTAESRNENGGAIISEASSSGFSLVYKTAQTDCRAITEADTGKVKLGDGDSAVFTFTVTSTQISDSATGFGWGFDFGNTVVFCTAATGVPKYTFHQHRYEVENGYPFTLGVASGSWKASAQSLPESSALLKVGNRVTIVTTLKRVSVNKYEMTVKWGGQMYSSDFMFAGDHSIDSIFIRSGDAKQSAFKPGDNYTISDVSFIVIPADAAGTVG